jgi:parallel beta-helix repeat protein
MALREKVSGCFLSVTLFMFLLTLVANVTPVAYLDGMFQQSDVVLSEPEREGMLLAGTPHARIAIDGDANFTDTALLEGWPGDGSPENPYIIDGLDIDISSNDRYCIIITNTQVSFIISNCRLTGAILLIIEARGYWGAGIFLENVTNCELVKNLIYSSGHSIVAFNLNYSTMTDNTCTSISRGFGISLEDSTHNIVVNNTCNNKRYGIWLLDSTYNTVANNTCSNNEYCITLRHSHDNTVANNTCYHNE